MYLNVSLLPVLLICYCRCRISVFSHTTKLSRSRSFSLSRLCFVARTVPFTVRQNMSTVNLKLSISCITFPLGYEKGNILYWRGLFLFFILRTVLRSALYVVLSALGLSLCTYFYLAHRYRISFTVRLVTRLFSYCRKANRQLLFTLHSLFLLLH